jgi:hypothetical protein
MLTRPKWFAAASPGTMCPGSGSRALLQTCAGRAKVSAANSSPQPRRRCLRASAEIGGVVLIIDAKNDRAARWYASYGAVPLSGKPLTLVMSLASFAADLQAAGQL